MLAVEEIEIVMVDAHAHEVARARLLIFVYEILRLPILGLPLADDVEKAGAAGMTIMLEVMLVGAVARALPRLAPLLIEQPRVPVAVLRLALRAPVRPDAQLRIAEPVGVAIAGGKAFPIRLDR
jgi:hypothetical protein